MATTIQGRVYKRTVVTVPSYFVDGLRVDFWPVTDVPGYSHRVIVADKSVGWLGTNSRPSAKTAVYFYEKRAQEKVAA